MRKIAIVTAALVSAGIWTTAQAGSLGRPCTWAPESTWLSLSDLKSKAESLGYKVEKAKLKASCGEIYAHDGNGVRTELFLDPTSGAVVAKQ
ncbi:PepSY domain-containing protein [Microvirga massiliensis]|uniref:PepSY domain-containing protein n=1 Tax=Microvirga massiliensis TaxID=1033741 RepID=UPI00062BB1AE|nr:PepSY domain-containing protein [Microvirga massiliensis]